MKKERKPEQFIHHPGYPGGTDAIREFIRNNLRYPEAAMKNKIEGTVVVAYEIDYQGDVIDTKIKSGIGYGCDEEAMRVVKLLKFGVAKHHKLRVTFHKTINIHFRLPQAKKQGTQYVYNYVEKKKEEKKSYNYNISFNR